MRILVKSAIHSSNRSITGDYHIAIYFLSVGHYVLDIIIQKPTREMTMDNTKHHYRLMKPFARTKSIDYPCGCLYDVN